MKNKIILGITTALVFGGGILALNPEDTLTVKLENPQQIVWNKPTTDAGWAEDVKAENFDIKSTGVLEEMVVTHTAKLEKIQDNGKKMVDCPQCIKYDLQTVHPEWTVQDVDNEYQNQLNQWTADIEKLKQSVERMNEELRLRKEGFVVPDKNKEGVKTKKANLDKVTSNKIRKIND